MRFIATKAKVLTRGTPPDDFLLEMILWGRQAPDRIFEVNQEPNDVYSSVKPFVGPYTSIEQRRAVMLEIMRVLAGFESSWKWNEGVDTTNPTSNTPDTMEAGAWQVSYNSVSFGHDLRALCDSRGIHDGIKFQQITKSDHPFAMEYIARLLRHTCAHNGPVKRHEIDPWLRREAIGEAIALVFNP